VYTFHLCINGALSVRTSICKQPTRTSGLLLKVNCGALAHRTITHREGVTDCTYNKDQMRIKVANGNIRRDINLQHTERMLHVLFRRTPKSQNYKTMQGKTLIALSLAFLLRRLRMG
jgi:hypothetical protein